MSDVITPGSFKRLVKYISGYKSRLFAGIVCTVFMGLSDAVMGPLAGILISGFGQLSESLTRTGSAAVDITYPPVNIFSTDYKLIPDIILSGAEEVKTALYILAGFIVFLMIFKGIFVYAKEYLMSSVVQKIVKRMRDDTFGNLMNLKISYFEREKTGEVMSRLSNDVQIVEQSLNSMVMVMQAIIYSVIFVTALLVTNWQLTLFAVIVFPLSAAVLKLFSDAIRKASRSIMAKIADINSFMQESITGIKIIKTYNREGYEHKRFAEKTYQNYAFSMKAVRLVAMLKPTNEFLSKVSMNAVLIFCGFLILNQSMSIAEFSTFIVLVTMAYKPLKTVGDVQPVIAKALASAERVFALQDEAPEPSLGITKMDEQVNGNIEFKNVHFSYTGKEPVLRGVDLSVKAGETIALVGPSGGGKSTIINLLLKFYQCSSGVITIDGEDITKLDLHYVRSQMSLVPQETILFSGSVIDNIRYGRLDATDEEIFEAARAANAHDFIKTLENGYDTEIGERGTQLSGGQRQRISIARAVLNNPPILLFDEATSALDSESEAAVKEATDRLMQKRTAFIIAHRLSTVRSADKIAVIDKGQVVQFGIHDELAKTDGLYRSLNELQLK